MAPGTHLARQQFRPAAHLPRFAETVPNLPLSPADRWDPIARVIPNLSPLSLETETVAGITPPLQYALLHAYFQL
jgi:hypothetical protein